MRNESRNPRQVRDIVDSLKQEDTLITPQEAQKLVNEAGGHLRPKKRKKPGGDSQKKTEDISNEPNEENNS